MKHIIAAYNDNGIVLATKEDEKQLRTAMMQELTSLVNQRKHYLLSSKGNQMWVHTTFAKLISFCDTYKNSDLAIVCFKIIQLEASFSMIMPAPDSKHEYRCTNFNFIIKLCHAYTNARSKNILG